MKNINGNGTILTRGKFIVLEGIDGCGKDTQQDLLKKYFEVNKLEENFVFLKVLDESKLHSDNLRTAMFRSGHKWNTTSEMLLFWADKFEILQEIKKNLEAGKNVLVNRWELSNLAYQIHGKQREDLRPFAETLQGFLEQDHKPDLYILFDISVEECEKRISLRNKEDYKKGDYFEQQKKDFFERVIKGYKIEIQKYNHKIINGEQTKEKVFEDIVKEIKKILV